MAKFSHQAEHNATKEEIWNWYNSPGSFRRIMPEWEGIIPMNAGMIEDGGETVFKVRIGPVRKTWIAKHHSIVSGESFADRMEKGPFGMWNHVHRFESTGDGMTTIFDDIEYKLPLHFLTGWTAGFTVVPRMRQLFKYRSARIKCDIKQIQATAEQPRQKVLVSGSTGMIGLQLCAFLETAGHDVYRLLRPNTKLPADVNIEKTVRWNDHTGEVLSGDMNGFDSVIHLAGAGIGDKRWSNNRKKLIRDSRIIPTENLSRLLATIDEPPKALLCGSAIGFYGNRGSEKLDENSASGNDFLSDLCSGWENACAPAIDAGIRVVNLRSGIVVSPLGGAVSKLLLPAKMGVSGPVAGGKQIQSWISLNDEVFAIHHLMMTDTCSGPYNLTAPNPLPQKNFAKILGHVVRRPAFMPLPGFVVRIMFGEMGQKLILEGQHVMPTKLQESGFEFAYSDLESCLRNCLGHSK